MSVKSNTCSSWHSLYNFNFILSFYWVTVFTYHFGLYKHRMTSVFSLCRIMNRFSVWDKKGNIATEVKSLGITLISYLYMLPWAQWIIKDWVIYKQQSFSQFWQSMTRVPMHVDWDKGFALLYTLFSCVPLHGKKNRRALVSHRLLIL